MNNRFLFLPLAAIVFTGPKPAQAQGVAPDRKVRIEVTTTEDGKTERVTRELDATDEQAIQDALRELGVLDELNLGSDGENVTINIMRSKEGGDAVSTALRMAQAASCDGGKCGYLGVSTGPLGEKATAKEGARVVHVAKGSPAEGAGLKENDVITALDGRAIAGPKELTEAVRARKAGDEVKVAYLRDGKKGTANVKLGERKAAAFAYGFGPDGPHGGPFDHKVVLERLKDMGYRTESRAFLGATPAEGSEDKGAVVGSVEEGSAAAAMGIREGDVVRKVNGAPVADFDALSKAIGAMKPGDEATVTLLRDGKEMEVKGTLGERKAERYRFRTFEGDGEPFLREFHFEGMEPVDREALRRQMDELRRELAELRRELGKEVTKEVRVTIESRELTAEEKELLRDKGVKGLDSELRVGDLRTFPNPSSGTFRLEFDVPERGDLQVVVHDAAGERVYQETITGYKGRYERTLDLSDKANGNYFVVITQKGRSAARKLVKQ